jgi:hypothetical protein
MTVTELFSHAKGAYDGKELTSRDALECVAEIEKLAMSTFLGRQRLVEVALREWMSSNRRGTITTRQDFEKAVRWIMETKWGIEP